MTFWSVFSDAAKQQQQQQQSPLQLNICRPCFELFLNAGTTATTAASVHNNPNCQPQVLLTKINNLPEVPVQFNVAFTAEKNREVRRRPYSDEELSSNDTESSGASSSSSCCCDACLGALQDINNATFALARAIKQSPFLDSKEISICTTVPPALCLWWDCLLGLFIECVYRCSLVTNNSSNNNTSSGGSPLLVSARLMGGAFVVATASDSSHYSWRGNVREEQLNGGLRGALVAEVRNFGLDCIQPPTDAAFGGSQEARRAFQATLPVPTQTWKYQSQGQGSGIICELLFQNDVVWAPTLRGQQLASAVLSGNLGPAEGCLSAAAVDPALLQHDAADLVWPRLVAVIAPVVVKQLYLSKANATAAASNNFTKVTATTCAVNVHHEPLFLYGRYRKFSRTMSQSPWFSNGARIGRELSLQEEICNRLIHVFFPGCDIATLNLEAAKGDPRLVVPSRPLSKQQAELQQRNEDDAEQQRVGHNANNNNHVRKQEIQQMRREDKQKLNPRAGVDEEVPSRRPRTDNDINNVDDEDQQQEQEDGSDNAINNHGNTAAGIFVSPHVRPFFNNVFGFCLYRFHAGGREDVDVRMLGNGRPFVVEVLNPHRQVFSQAELDQLAQAVSDSSLAVETDSLQVVGRGIMGELQKDAESKRKAYRCVCYSHRPIKLGKNDPVFAKIQAQLPIVLKQKTPTRVLHRRSSLTRERAIYNIEFELLNEHWMIVDLITQAGTYVKEFCHGDLGRTMPNLGTLLESPFTDIIQLDVKYLISSVGGAENGGNDAAAGDRSDDDDVDED